jgi:YHS domain-containing protein
MEDAKMRNTRAITLFLFILFVGLLALTNTLQAQEKVICQVSGKEIEKSEAAGSLEYKGTTYYFCCENCKESFLKDPEKYINSKPGEHHEHAEETKEHGDAEHQHGEAAHEHGENEAGNTVKDPVCGMEIQKDKAKATYEYKGKTYYFCTTGCKEKFAKDPDSFLKSQDEKIICPVMGNEVKDPENAASSEYKGKTYYFCCAGCKPKFDADPEKYIK